jgi:Ni/Co efflux regulator RcnB
MPKARYLIVALVSFGFMLSAQADPPGGKHEKKDKHEKHEKYEKHDKRSKAERRDHFIDDDRVVIRDFYTRNPSSLPPGLAKRNGNLPPGLAKRGGDLPPGLSRGQEVPAEYRVHLQPLPRELEIRLPPPPHEVIRRIIGRDIVMIQKHNNMVLDVMRDALPH